MITAFSEAPEGSVAKLVSYESTTFKHDSVILCRITAPLVSFAFQLIRRSVACRILGREIGQGLVTLAKRIGDKRDFAEFETYLSNYENREIAKLIAKGEEQAADQLHDRCECLRIFYQGLDEHDHSLEALCRSILSLFDDNATNILTLSTVHKAKGLEWPDVFILDKAKYMPSPYAKRPWQIKQEYNLIYVAYTRAQLNLWFIETGKWKVKGPEAKQTPSLNQLLTEAD